MIASEGGDSCNALEVGDSCEATLPVPSAPVYCNAISVVAVTALCMYECMYADCWAIAGVNVYELAQDPRMRYYCSSAGQHAMDTCLKVRCYALTTVFWILEPYKFVVLHAGQAGN